MGSNVHIFDRLETYRTSIICIIILSILIAFCGCGSEGDWMLVLNNGYIIFRANSHTIHLAKKSEWEDSHFYPTVLPKYFVSYFCFNDRFVGVRGISTEDTIASDLEIKRSRQEEYAEYYLVDAETGEIWGPYQNETDFLTKCEELNTGDMGEWIDTKKMDYYSGDLEKYHQNK